MRVWLVTIGEPVPVGEQARDRLHRTGQLARFLAVAGHEVTWWTSTFDHFRKRHLFEKTTTIKDTECLRTVLIRGCGYGRNVSLSRIRDHRQIARAFSELIREEPDIPDIIVAALPTVELCAESVRFAQETGVPVVLDMRDMWPDIFVDAAPRPIRPLARLAVSRMFSLSREACSGATAIIGITDAFRDWGLARGRRCATAADRSFPFAYSTSSPDPQKLKEAEIYWDSLGIGTNEPEFVACFFGAIGRQLDIQSLIDAGRILWAEGRRVRLVLCGKGDRLEDFQDAASDCPNILFPGWVDAAQIRVLMGRSSVGLDPLPDRYDFLATINNKALEYMSCGLPVISSPRKGVLFDLLREQECGISYDHGDAQALADILSDLADDPERVRRLSGNATRLFNERFSAETVCRDMMNYLKEVVSGVAVVR